MSKRKPVLPTIRRAIDSSPWDPSQGGWERADTELRAAEAVIRAAKRLRTANEMGHAHKWPGAVDATFRALARLDKATGRAKR